MHFTLITIGRLKEKYWCEAVTEYSKRMSRYGKLKILELQDEKAPEAMSHLEGLIVLQKEGERILKAIPSDAYVVVLAIDGKKLSSEEMAQKIASLELSGISHMVFIIGGSLGLSKAVMDKADFSLSFSNMTFPHQMMRVILLEQIYRSIKINKGEPYHK